MDKETLINRFRVALTNCEFVKYGRVTEKPRIRDIVEILDEAIDEIYEAQEKENRQFNADLIDELAKANEQWEVKTEGKISEHWPKVDK